MSALTSAGYITTAGFFFMLANLVMKTMGDMPIYILYPSIAVAFAAGAYFEVEALRSAQLGYAVTFILVCELLFSILIACLFLKESYSGSNMIGIVLVMVGIILLHLPGKSIPPQQEIAAGEQPK